MTNTFEALLARDDVKSRQYLFIGNGHSDVPVVRWQHSLDYFRVLAEAGYRYAVVEAPTDVLPAFTRHASENTDESRAALMAGLNATDYLRHYITADEREEIVGHFVNAVPAAAALGITIFPVDTRDNYVVSEEHRAEVQKMARALRPRLQPSYDVLDALQAAYAEICGASISYQMISKLARAEAEVAHAGRPDAHIAKQIKILTKGNRTAITFGSAHGPELAEALGAKRFFEMMALSSAAPINARAREAGFFRQQLPVLYVLDAAEIVESKKGRALATSEMHQRFRRAWDRIQGPMPKVPQPRLLPLRDKNFAIVPE